MLLPLVAGRLRRGLMLAALLSPVVALVVERGNGDLLVFALAAVAMVLLERGRERRPTDWCLSGFC
jgi:hypothetical protein